MKDIVGGPYHPPSWRCHSTGKQAVQTSQFMARVVHAAAEETAAEDCRYEGCMRPSHIGAPGPPETTCHQGQVATGVGLLWASQRGKS